MALLGLGLRRAELAGLTLDDIDWRTGELVVRGKGARVDRLPLPAEVGEAIAGYLQRGRPVSEQPYPDNRAPRIMSDLVPLLHAALGFPLVGPSERQGVGFGAAWYSYRSWWSADGVVRIVRALGIGVEGAVRIAGMLVS